MPHDNDNNNPFTIRNSNPNEQKSETLFYTRNTLFLVKQLLNTIKNNYFLNEPEEFLLVLKKELNSQNPFSAPQFESSLEEVGIFLMVG